MPSGVGDVHDLASHRRLERTLFGGERCVVGLDQRTQIHASDVGRRRKKHPGFVVRAGPMKVHRSAAAGPKHALHPSVCRVGHRRTRHHDRGVDSAQVLIERLAGPFGQLVREVRRPRRRLCALLGHGTEVRATGGADGFPQYGDQGVGRSRDAYEEDALAADECQAADDFLGGRVPVGRVVLRHQRIVWTRGAEKKRRDDQDAGSHMCCRYNPRPPYDSRRAGARPPGSPFYEKPQPSAVNDAVASRAIR